MMAKCECCGVREADRKWSSLPDAGKVSIVGAMYSGQCLEDGNRNAFKISDRIRARRAKATAEQPSDTIPAPPPSCQQCGELMRDHDAGHCKPKALCCSCSKPERPILATCGELCVYCNHSREGLRAFDRGMSDNITAGAMLNTEAHPGEAAARARLEAADRKALPRANAQTRMLAEGERYATKVYPVVEDFE